MTFAISGLIVAAFSAVWVRRFKRDLEDERAFRAQLSGLNAAPQFLAQQ